MILLLLCEIQSRVPSIELFLSSLCILLKLLQTICISFYRGHWGSEVNQLIKLFANLDININVISFISIGWWSLCAIGVTYNYSFIMCHAAELLASFSLKSMLAASSWTDRMWCQPLLQVGTSGWQRSGLLGVIWKWCVPHPSLAMTTSYEVGGIRLPVKTNIQIFKTAEPPFVWVLKELPTVHPASNK